jgi:tRNA-guanine family transglycosylase
MLGAMLLTLHNLRFFHDLLARIRRAIEEDRLSELRSTVLPPMTRKLRPDQAV